MARPKMTLDNWCNEDRKLKMEFLQDESQRENGFLYWDNRNTYVSKLQGNWLQSVALITNHEGPTSYLHITEECFKELKRRYKVFTNKKRNDGLIKKQYSFQPHIANEIKKMKEDNHLAREEYAIEYFINSYLNKKNANDFYAKINLKDIRLQVLGQENHNLNNEIQQLNQGKFQLKQRINELIELLAIAYLMNDHYTDLLQENSINMLAPNMNEDNIRAKVDQLNELFKPSF